MFFNWLRHKPRLVSDGAGHSFLRVILMVALFFGMAWAFSANSERYVYKFSADSRINDHLNAFSEEDRKEIVAILSRFDKKFQIKVHVETRKDFFSSTETKDGAMLLGLCPSKQQMVLFMPALWRTAIGEGSILQLKQNIMEPAFDNGTWPKATAKVLLLLEQRFDAVMQ
ncbi:hypothetical protein LJB93_01335 [Desulfovibrio sp. OttesenSCG-928-F07]|nr:hypothetical protein [Desulfovibrio sp. OttesenSCG-928-F07]